MSLHVIAEAFIAFLILLGGAFALIGSWGLTRLPTLMSRLHGPTKATTLGVGSCLISSMIYFPLKAGSWSAHELLITLFLFITAPVSANMIAKAHLHRRRSGNDGEGGKAIHDPLPPPPPDAHWASFGSEDGPRMP
ncbi:Na+/H+ antiporter subunit G [Sphingobium lignivorans]|uniref:Multicomponent K+:H+ antiporter subunit G n=1 Tax=Sphingobium lignivorans TaxID=2735886 RepID=A0ABR6NEQ3_9SPHN|nr:Na+/H+ antiporter subunit G [Sphingobium lignivorans]MBB5985759.1 multicomponent K+:H+ antiporter subunit G [Sphingobium lignivorans]